MYRTAIEFKDLSFTLYTYFEFTRLMVNPC
jgi:hypothetical protein